MIDSLFHAYIPLLLWPGIGFLLSRFMPERFPKLLGLALYWVGVPLQLLVLGRQTDLSDGGRLIPFVSVGILLLSISLAWLSWWGLRSLTNQKATAPSQPSKAFRLNALLPNYSSLGRESLGSCILASMLGNTGFVGLALTQVLFGAENSNWAILYSVTNNVIGTYGVAVFIASYFGRGETKNHWLIQLRDVVTVPSLWTFLIGFNTRSIELPPLVESGLDQAIWVVIASALLLVGLRLESMQGWRSLKLGLIPTLLKVLIVPALVGLGATHFGVTGAPCVVLVLMAGTPTGLSVLILAEVYNLDRELLTSTIAMTFFGLLLVLPLWLSWFG